MEAVEAWAGGSMEEDRRFRAIFENALDALLIADERGHYVDANPAACELLGLPKSEVLAMSVTDLVPPEGRPETQHLWQQFVDQGSLKGEFHIVRRDGQTRDVEFSATANFLPGLHLSVLRDVTDRKRAQEELRRKDEEVRDFLENGAVALHWAGADGTILWANQAELDLLGYSVDEYIGHQIAEFHADREAIEEILRRLIARETLRNFEARLQARDGSIKHVLITSNVLWDGDRFVHTRCFTRDITERKLAEEERDRLLAAEQASREEAVEAVRTRDELLAVVSHDLKNPLATIAGNSQLLRKRLSDMGLGEEQRLTSLLGRINTASNKMAAMIEEIMDFARLHVGQPLALQLRPTDLVELADRIVAECRQSTEAHELRLEASEPEIVGQWDPDRLERVLANLLSNAIKYSPKGGEIVVRVAREERDGRSWGTLAVSDQGVGIPAMDLPHIFEWFRRASNISERIGGAGIGLASSLNAVEQHRGTISVTSQPGAGSTFTVRLPIE
jgi:PAS domain S-box-containing protein